MNYSKNTEDLVRNTGTFSSYVCMLASWLVLAVNILTFYEYLALVLL